MIVSDKQVRILLVEDEFITRDSLREALEDMGYHISGEAMRAEQAIKILEEGKTDLAILDIHLKGELTGIWIGKQIQRDYHIPFIYLTAFGDKNTISEATQTAPAAYLSKPFSPTEIYASIELAVQEHARRALVEEKPQNSILADSIFVKEELTYQRLQLTDINYVESLRNYVKVVTVDKEYKVRSSLTEFSQRLPQSHFFQTHRAFFVNLKEVTEIGGNFVRVGGKEVPLSRSVKAELMEKIDLFN